MTEALQTALDWIERNRERAIRDAETSPFPFVADNLPERLADLDLRADVYRFITDMDAVTTYEERCRLLDALYVYTRKSVMSEPGLVLGSDDALPDDAFEIARLRWFSVSQWWQIATGDYSPELLDFSEFAAKQAKNGIPEFRGHVVIEPGVFIRENQSVLDKTRHQSFVSNGYTDLIMVLRQWVEEPADANLIDALANNSSWQHLLSESPYRWRSERDELQRLGLPYTPSVQRFLRQQHRAPNDPLPYTQASAIPRRGGIVTTFVLKSYGVNIGDEGGEGGEGVERLRLVQQTCCQAGWVTGNFYRQAAACLNSHAAWVEKQNLGILNRVAFPRSPDVGSKPKYPNTQAELERFIAGEVGFTRTSILATLKKEMVEKAGAPVADDKVSAQFRTMLSRIK